MYDKDTDLLSIQADVLTTDVSTNSKISKSKQLKTTNTVVTKAINELNSTLQQIVLQVANAVNNSDEAKKGVDGVKEEVPGIVQEVLIQKMTEIVSGGIFNDEIECSDNQTVFTLTKKPLDVENILFYVNGVKYPKKDTAYDAENNTVTWKNVPDAEHPHGFQIKSTDSVSAVYMAQ